MEFDLTQKGVLRGGEDGKGRNEKNWDGNCYKYDKNVGWLNMPFFGMFLHIYQHNKSKYNESGYKVFKSVLFPV